MERFAGLERARHVAEAQAAAVAFVRQVVVEEGIECDLEEVEGAVHVDTGTAGGDARASRALREVRPLLCRTVQSLCCSRNLSPCIGFLHILTLTGTAHTSGPC